MFDSLVDSLVDIAVDRLRTGSLGDHERAMLANLLVTLQRSVHTDDVMPTVVNAAFLSAVHVLGADPAAEEAPSLSTANTRIVHSTVGCARSLGASPQG